MNFTDKRQLGQRIAESFHLLSRDGKYLTCEGWKTTYGVGEFVTKLIYDIENPEPTKEEFTSDDIPF